MARTEAARWDIELVAGVELTSELDGREIHILGYFIRDDDRAICSAMEWLRTGRATRLEAMVDRLRTLGLTIDVNAVGPVFPAQRWVADTLPITWYEPARQ